MTTSLAPRRLRALAMWVMTLTWVATALLPHSRMRSDSAISRGSGPILAPTPATQPIEEMREQMVLSWPE